MAESGHTEGEAPRLAAAGAVGLAVFLVVVGGLGWPSWLALLVAVGAGSGAGRLACDGGPAASAERAALAYLLPLGAALLVDLALKALGWLPGVACLVAALTGWAMWVLLSKQTQTTPAAKFLRGRELHTVAEAGALTAAARARSKVPDPPARPFWGGEFLPYEAGTAHFLVAGTTGSGKTVTIRLLLQEALRAVGQGAGQRALIYDDKQEFLPLLTGMGLGCEVKLLNPFDQRCWAWDIAADVTEPAVCEEMTSILVPDNPKLSQPFFDRAVRRLVRATLTAFMKTVPKRPDGRSDWDLWDVIVAMQTEENLGRVLDRTAATQRERRLIANSREGRSVMMTAATLMMSYESLARAWHEVPYSRRLSLTSWVTEESILLMSNDPTIEQPLGTINQAIFKRLSQLLTTHATGVSGRTWVVIDEAREGKRLDGLLSLLNKGRSQGVCCVLGFQAFEGLQEAYGKELASELANACSHKALLALPSDVSAEWASRQLGSVERLEYRQSWGTAPGPQSGSSRNTGEHLETRPAVLPAEFQTLPLLQVTDQLTGWYLTPYAGAYQRTYDQAFLNQHLQPPDQDETIFDRRPAAQQELGDWAEEDVARLGLGPVPPPPTKQSSTPEQAAEPVAEAEAGQPEEPAPPKRGEHEPQAGPPAAPPPPRRPVRERRGDRLDL